MDLVRDVTGLAARPVGLASRLATRPMRMGVGRLRRGRSLEDAVRERVVLVTGASSGIGAAASQRLGAAGAQVVLVARDPERLEQARAGIAAVGGVAHVHPCDLTDVAAIDATVAAVLAQHGRVDILVNNAGRSIRRSVEHSYARFHDYERTMALNYFAAVRLILALLPGMRERRRGQIVNISSVGVQTRVPRFSGYIASKAALDAFSDAVQAEVLSDRIRFTTIHMPLVRTPMIAPTRLYDRFPALSADEAGALIAKAIVDRPRRIGAPFGQAAAFADAVSPELMDLVRHRGYRLFEESDDADGGDPSAAAAAFERVTRGVHW